MATRNQVLSLFGMSPEQMIQQEQEARRKEISAIEDPYRRSGALIGQQLGGMMGGTQESSDVQRQRQLYDQLQGVNFESPEQMRQAASMLQTQFPDRALQLLMMASDMETAAQQRASSAAQAEAQGIESVPKFMGYKYVKTGVDQLGNDIYGTQPYYENVPINRADLNDYYEGKGKYKGWLNPVPTTEDGNKTSDAEKPLERKEDAVDYDARSGTKYVRQDGQLYLRNDEGNPVGNPLTEEEIKRANVRVAPPGGIKPRPPSPAYGGKTKEQDEWDKQYGEIYNPDGTRKANQDPNAGYTFDMG